MDNGSVEHEQIAAGLKDSWAGTARIDQSVCERHNTWISIGVHEYKTLGTFTHNSIHTHLSSLRLAHWHTPVQTQICGFI